MKIPRRMAMTAAFCVLAATKVCAQQAGTKVEPAPNATHHEAANPALKPVQPALPNQPEAPVATEWSPQEIELANARCTALLKGLDVVTEPTTPFREGDCGTAAPVKLISIGKPGGQVTLNPPIAMTCDMVAAIHKWVQQDLQPLAKKHLGAPLARIDAMSGYSCRNAYGRAKSRLSEHGRANALDIGAFVTARSQATTVLADWGMTAREIAAQAAAAAKAEAAAAAAAAAQPKPAQQVVTGTNRAPGQAGHQAGHIAAGVAMPGISIQLPGSLQHEGHMGLVGPNRLGGPKTQGVPQVVPQAGLQSGQPGPAVVNGKMDFLRAAHRSACKIFGTVLGPEANKAHRNHFHIDMAERNGRVMICE